MQGNVFQWQAAVVDGGECDPCPRGQFSNSTRVFQYNQSLFPSQTLDNSTVSRGVSSVRVQSPQGVYNMSVGSGNDMNQDWLGLLGPAAHAGVQLKFKTYFSSDILNCSAASVERQIFHGVCGAWIQVELPGPIVPENLQVRGHGGNIKEFQWLGSADGGAWTPFPPLTSDLSQMHAVHAYRFFAVVIRRCTPNDQGNCIVTHMSIGGKEKVSDAVCSACLPGFFANETGSAECEQCAQHTYANTSGNTECKECGKNFYTLGPGFSQCLSCGSPLDNIGNASLRSTILKTNACAARAIHTVVYLLVHLEVFSRIIEDAIRAIRTDVYHAPMNYSVTAPPTSRERAGLAAKLIQTRPGASVSAASKPGAAQTNATVFSAEMGRGDRAWMPGVHPGEILGLERAFVRERNR